MTDSVQELFGMLLLVDRVGIEQILKKAMTERGIEEVGETLMKAMIKLGEGWEDGEVSLAQMYMGGVICEEILSSIIPETDKIDNNLPIVGSAVFLDHHGLGMKIVSGLVRTHRYPLVNIGIGVNTDKIITEIHKNKIQILLVSVLMYPSALALKELSEKIDTECPDVFIVAGGAPFRLDRELYKKVGVHRSAGNASEIFGILKDLGKNIAPKGGLL